MSTSSSFEKEALKKTASQSAWAKRADAKATALIEAAERIRETVRLEEDASHEFYQVMGSIRAQLKEVTGREEEKSAECYWDLDYVDDDKDAEEFENFPSELADRFPDLSVQNQTVLGQVSGRWKEFREKSNIAVADEFWAFMDVARALKKHWSALGGASLSDITVGLYYLYQQRFMRSNRWKVPQSNLAPPSASDLSELLRLSEFGDFKRLLRMAPHGETWLTKEEKLGAALWSLGFELQCAYLKSSFRKPAFFVAVRTQEVVVSVRGTASLRDMLTDLDCAQESLGGELWAHAGFAAAAEWLVLEVQQILLPYSSSGAGLCVVGHSLGAAVASLAFLQLRAAFSTSRCVAFAAPPCMSAQLADVSADLGITSVVLHDDVIPRLNQQNLEGLRLEIQSSWRAAMKEEFEQSPAGAVVITLGLKYSRVRSLMTSITELRPVSALCVEVEGIKAVKRTLSQKLSKTAGQITSLMTESLADTITGSFSPNCKANAPAETLSGSRDVDAQNRKPGERLTSQDQPLPVLHPPGRVLFIWRSPTEEHHIFHVPNGRFDSIELSATMRSDHKLSNYRVALEQLCP